ncbi:MAG: DUF1080 domain-containing protein [Thermoguttaceae bacterium]|nr:DUF1080 domain-containing protein [Thermoguttaceae bacterium]
MLFGKVTNFLVGVTYIGVLVLGLGVCPSFSQAQQHRGFWRGRFDQCDNAVEFDCCQTFRRHRAKAAPLYWELGEKKVLFNGKDLSGWTNVTGDAPPTVWSVKDGMISKVVSDTKAKEEKKLTTGDLFAKDKYEDFILEFEFKISVKGNSGVKYKSWNTSGYGLGCEFQIYDDLHGENKPVYRTASLYAVYEPFTSAAPIRMDGFNKGKIIVMGSHIEHWLNGQLTVSVDTTSCDWQARVAASKFADVPEFGTTQVGRIMLQDHGSEVWFKNITITPLYKYSSWCD